MTQERNVPLPFDVMLEFVLLPNVLPRVYNSKTSTFFYKLWKMLYGHLLHPFLFKRSRGFKSTTELWRCCDLSLDLAVLMQQHGEPPARVMEDTSDSDTRPLLKTSSSGLRNRRGNRLPPASIPTNFNQDLITQACSIPIVITRIDQAFLHSSHLKYERRQVETFTCTIEHLQEACQTIAARKGFPSESSAQKKVLFAALAFVAQTYNCCLYLNSRASTKFDTTNPQHERLLSSLWDHMMNPHVLDNRISESWKLLGFQGKDPATDFRGMGMLGLENLLYFAQTHPEDARRVLVQSWGGQYVQVDPKSVTTLPPSTSPTDSGWYSWAIVSISLSQFALELARTRQLQRLFYEAAPKVAALNLLSSNRGKTPVTSSMEQEDWQEVQMTIVKSIFQEFNCYLMVSFHQLWTGTQPLPTVLDFNRIMKDFKSQITLQLATNPEKCVLDASCLR